MSRLSFNSQGQLMGIDNKLIDFGESKKKSRKELKTSESLGFLKAGKKMESIFDKPYWSLYEGNVVLEPLKFSNGKTQEDVVKEIAGLIRGGNKVVFLRGVCGTGKSAIALNLARTLGTASIVVPIKSLQRQYEEEYMGKKFVIKSNGEKMKIAMITGRDNHDSIIEPGVSCADPFLPDNIKFTENNRGKLKEYYDENPFISSSVLPPMKALRRISIAPANPYWSPILPSVIELNQLTDADKKRYIGMNGKEYTFYHRKKGCSYYDQYLAYMDADVIIFNSAKYLTELAMGRKPRTDVEIIDEADEFLDSLSNQVELNLTRLEIAVKTIFPEGENAQFSIDKIVKLINAEETNKRAIGIDENEVTHISESRIAEIFEILIADKELAVEIEVDDSNYCNVALEAARNFKELIKDTYLTYRKDENFLLVTLVSTNLSKKFKEIVDGNEAVVLMSGTLHSETVLRNIFGVENFVTVDAETLSQGAIEITRTGKEFDCRYSNFNSGKYSRGDYLRALGTAVERGERPTLVHVNAFSDLPTLEEIDNFNVTGLMSKEELLDLQRNDKTGKLVSEFKEGKRDTLFTTKCSRGIDFPGDTCRSVVFTKYPNPNVKNTFWKILERTHREFYWDFYKDKARREFLQRIYRALRSKEDHVSVLSPDLRVLEAVRDLQEKGH